MVIAGAIIFFVAVIAWAVYAFALDGTEAPETMINTGVKPKPNDPPVVQKPKGYKPPEKPKHEDEDTFI